MKKLMFLYLLTIYSNLAFSLEIKELTFYQTNYNPISKRETFAAYMLRNNPCVFIKNLDKNETTKFCKIKGTDWDLEKDFPSIFVGDQSVNSSSVFFTVAASHNEQRCRIFVPRKEITCEPTGNN